MSKDRRSPSGTTSSIKSTIVIASTPVALTSAATATASMTGAQTDDVVTLAPRANLNASLAIAFKRCYAAGLIVIGFTNVGASTNTGAVTFDCAVQKL